MSRGDGGAKIPGTEPRPPVARWACVGLGIDPERNGARVGHGSGNCELARTRRPDVPPVRSVNAGPGVPSEQASKMWYVIVG